MLPASASFSQTQTLQEQAVPLVGKPSSTRWLSLTSEAKTTSYSMPPRTTTRSESPFFITCQDKRLRAIVGSDCLNLARAS